MKTYRVRYETKILTKKEGTEIVEAQGKGQAMLAAQMRLHPDARPDEPYFYFEPLSIRPLPVPGTFEVRYQTKIASELTGEMEVAAENADKAVAKVRFTVHPDLIPPKCFKAVEVVEVV
jgi:hypothetical protein